MATATVVRPTQALRNRRDPPRPSISKRQTTLDGAMEPASKKRKRAEPYVRDQNYILSKHTGKPASLTVRLYDKTFRIDGIDSSWHYEGPMKCIMDHFKNQTVPHEMMEELLSPTIPWYDGCLIVEVQNHRTKAGKEKGGQTSSEAKDGSVKFGMHNYNPHITPSPMVPYPSKAAMNDDSPENANTDSNDMLAPERPHPKEGQEKFTLVLHPTPLSQHLEMLLLSTTPADHFRNKKRGSDSATPSTAQPPTPQLSVPPTPLTQTTRGPLTQSQKMCLEEGDMYTFQADLLIATEPPLFLDPVDNPQDAEKVLDMFQNPLHHADPPSSKTRKRTTAEVAADDAQAAETERRMLIMDERIKPAGAGAVTNDNQSAAASLGFSRFKTIEMVRQKHEEADRVKKEEEARIAMEKKQQEEQHIMQQQKMQQQRQREMLLAQQQQQQQANQPNAVLQMRAEQLRAQQARAQQAMMNQAHAHPQQNGIMPNQQPGFQQVNQTSMAQSSPIVRQQTPMMNSSPMMPQGGFPMVQTSSQGAGSPIRPTSAAIQNQMARQASQQQGSRNNTPQIPQGTPAMGQAMPNRPVNQTPRMQPGSPAVGMQQGTPTSMPMSMQTPQMNNQSQLTPEQQHQQQMIRNAMAQSQQGQQLHAASPMSHMTPEQIQAMHSLQSQYNQSSQQQQAMIQQAKSQGNMQLVERISMEMRRRQEAFKARQAQILGIGPQQQQMNAHMAGNVGQAGSPGNMQQMTPQMGHAHPQQGQQQQGQQGNMQDPNQMQMAAAQAKATQLARMRQSAQFQQAQQQLTTLIQQYGSINNVPPNIVTSLPPPAQQLLRQQMARQQSVRQQQSMRAQAAQQQTQQQNGGGAGGNGTEQVPGSQPNPQYMQQLRDNQAMLAQASQQMRNQQQQQQAQANGMNTMGMQSFTMNGHNGFAGSPQGQQQGGQGVQGGNNGNDLTQQFAAMANALNRSTSNQGGPQGGGGQGMQ